MSWSLLLAVAGLPELIRATSISELLATENIGITESLYYPNSTSSQIVSPTGDPAFIAASLCNDQRVSYAAAVSSWQQSVTPTTGCIATTVPYRVSDWDMDVPVPWTTLCDGHARTPANFTYPVTTEHTYYNTSYCGIPTPLHTAPYPGPSPNCTIGESDCAALWETLVVSATLFSTTPSCTTSSGFYPHCGECTIAAPQVQLLYWPVTTVSGDLCKGNGSTITPTPTGNGPNTMVFSGHTLTSPSIYLSLAGIFGVLSNGGPCGSSRTSYIVPVAQSDLSSIGYSMLPPTYNSSIAYTQSFNLANLNWPLPWTAYKANLPYGNLSFDWSDPVTISNSYMPDLLLPTTLGQLQPAWESCVASKVTMWDPPYALQAVQSIASAMETTLAAATLATTTNLVAVPGNTIQSSMASVTNAPVAYTTASSIVPLLESVESAAADTSVTSPLDSTSSAGESYEATSHSTSARESLDAISSIVPPPFDTSSPKAATYIQASESPASIAPASIVPSSSDLLPVNVASYIAQVIQLSSASSVASPGVSTLDSDTPSGYRPPIALESASPSPVLPETAATPLEPTASTVSQDFAELLTALVQVGDSSAVSPPTTTYSHDTLAPEPTSFITHGSSTATLLLLSVPASEETEDVTTSTVTDLEPGTISTDPHQNTTVLTLPSGTTIGGSQTIVTDGATSTVAHVPTVNGAAGPNVETSTGPSESSTQPASKTISPSADASRASTVGSDPSSSSPDAQSGSEASPSSPSQQSPNATVSLAPEDPASTSAAASSQPGAPTSSGATGSTAATNSARRLLLFDGSTAMYLFFIRICLLLSDMI